MLMPAIRAIDYPCRCLWRGFEQITSTAPWRRMILHFSHMGLTEARTFTAPQSIRVKENRRRGPGDGQAPGEQPEKISSRDQSCFGAFALSARPGSGGPGGLFEVPRSQDPRAFRGDRHRVLEVGRQRPVLAVDRPVVGRHADRVVADGHHRFDGQNHALLELLAGPGLAVVRDLRVLVHVAADPVADERADDAEAVGLDALLDRVADVAEAISRPALLDGIEERSPGRGEEAL